MNTLRVFLLEICLLLCCLGTCFGQDYRATVQGIVTDSSDALIVGATVNLLNVETGVSSIQTTNNMGQYRFGFVEPGTYRLSAEMAGFAIAVDDKVTVQTRADITVNFRLKPGALTESVTVSASPVELQFNTSTKDLIITRKQLMELPIQARNPYSLALLDPAVQNIYPGEATPYHMWASTQMNFGGRTSRENDVQIDGSSVQIGPKGTYTPAMDGVQEFSVQQVAVDAEYGHSAGGILSLATRQGTNEYHGTGYYFGRNPALNADTNGLTHTPSMVRNHIFGANVGGPIKKNKLFTFATYERWRKTSPAGTIAMTLPTEAQRNGDFSQLLQLNGAQKLIYDPFSTQFDPTTGVATRTPFPGNKIPASQIDHGQSSGTVHAILADIWLPNNAGDNITGINNYRKTSPQLEDYWNFSERTDWNISEKMRVFGRASRFWSNTGLPDYTGMNSPAESDGASTLMAATNFAGDALYTLSPNTVIDFRFSYSGMEDSYNGSQSTIGKDGLAKLWPSAWYASYLDQAPNIYFPSLSVGANAFGATRWPWIQRPHTYNFSAKLAKNFGRHNVKTGIETRYASAFISYPAMTGFDFGAATTASTYVQPNLAQSGDPWATFLLGVPDNGSWAAYSAPGRLSLRYYAGYLQDDLKLNRNVSLNLGLRYEYEGAPVDAQNRYSRGIDFNTPLPALQQNPPPYTAEEIDLRAQYLGASAATPPPTGAWLYTDSGHRSPFNAPKYNFSPRAGVAIRINDRTALQLGWGRFLVMSSQVQNGLLDNPRFVGFSTTSYILPQIQGVPQTDLSNPFPGNNPLTAVTGKTRGVYTLVGNNTYGQYRYQNYKDGVMDRFNFTLQRELPARLKLDLTFYMNLSHNLDCTTTWDSMPVNAVDPNLLNSLQGLGDTQYPNPFYQYLTPNEFPGGLRNRQTISLSELLRPYPQYQDVYVNNVPMAKDNTRSFQVKVQRGYANGLSLLASYMYYRERVTWYQNDESYYKWEMPWRDGEYPRHRSSLAATYELPFGKGRPLMNQAGPLANGVLGGWSVNPIVSATSGNYIFFGGWIPLTVVGDPAKNVPSGYVFNPGAFAPLPAYTLHTAPAVFPGVVGPKHWNIDASLVKGFPIRERWKLEFRAEAYNLTNSIVLGDPNSDIGSGDFGQISRTQINTGRTLQYCLRLSF